MPFANFEGVDIYFERHGENGEPLVLVHGFTGDISTGAFRSKRLRRRIGCWCSTTAATAARRCRATPRPMASRPWPSDVEALAVHVGFDRYHLVGHSMGGGKSQEIALRSPDRLLSLTLHDTSYRFNHRPLEPPENPPVLPPERLQYVTERMGRMSSETLLGCWNALQQRRGTEERLPRLHVPPWSSAASATPPSSPTARGAWPS